MMTNLEKLKDELHDKIESLSVEELMMLDSGGIEFSPETFLSCDDCEYEFGGCDNYGDFNKPCVKRFYEWGFKEYE